MRTKKSAALFLIFALVFLAGALRGKKIKDYFPPYMGVHTLPCVSDSTVYFVGVKGDLVVIRGKEIEKFEVPGVKLHFLPRIAVKDDVVFVSLGLGKGVVAFSVKTGAVVWRYDSNDVISSPVVVGDRVFFADSSGTLHVLEAKSGKEIAKYSTGMPFPVFTAYPVVKGDEIFVGVDRFVYVLRIADEGLVEKEKVHLGGLVKSQVLLTDGGYAVVIYSTSQEKKGYYIEYHWGKDVKRVFLGVVDEYPGMSCADTDGSRFVVGVGKKAVTLDKNGNVVWEKSYENYVNLVRVRGGEIGVAVGSRGYLYDDFGETVLTVFSPNKIVAPPVRVGKTVVWADEYGNLWVSEGGG